MGSLRTAINRQMIEAYEGLDDWRKTAEIVRAEHRGILEAVQNREALQAARLVSDHIHDFYKIGNVGGTYPPG